MFSGRHDLETMKCSDGSFFIDRDGTHFRHILNYLRDGENVVESFPKSAEILQEILREAMYYQFEALVTALKPVVRRFNAVSQSDITVNFTAVSSTCCSDYGAGNLSMGSHSTQAISYKVKNMKSLSFSQMKFLHPVSFISCDLSNTSFVHCSFESDVAFEDCILNSTRFNVINGLVTNSCTVSFTGSKTDKTNFDSNLRTALESAGKIK